MLVRILITWATRNHWITGQGGRGSPLPQWVPPARYTKTSSMASHGRPLRIIDRRCQIYPYKRFCVTLYRANALDMKWSCAGFTPELLLQFHGARCSYCNIVDGGFWATVRYLIWEEAFELLQGSRWGGGGVSYCRIVYGGLLSVGLPVLVVSQLRRQRAAPDGWRCCLDPGRKKNGFLQKYSNPRLGGINITTSFPKSYATNQEGRKTALPVFYKSTPSKVGWNQAGTTCGASSQLIQPRIISS